MVLSVLKPVTHLNERSTVLLIQVGHGRGVEIWLIRTPEVSFFFLVTELMYCCI